MCVPAMMVEGGDQHAWRLCGRTDTEPADPAPNGAGNLGAGVGWASVASSGLPGIKQR